MHFLENPCLQTQRYITKGYKELEPGTNWYKQIGISVAIGVVFGVIPVAPCIISFVSYLYSSGTIHKPSLLEAITAIEMTLLTTVLATVFQVQLEIRRYLTEHVKHNPIIKALPKMSEKISKIPMLSIKNGSIDFAVDSIERMSDEGFVQININFENYIKYLTTLAKSANKSIYGTNTFRPQIIKIKIEKNITGLAKYIKTVRESKCSKTIRINILSPSVVKDIILDALKALTANGTNIKILAGEFIPEVVWYLEKINGWNNKKVKTHKIKLLWTTHTLAMSAISPQLPKSEISDGEIDDYSIFDGQILSLYDYKEKLDKGVMVLLWDSEPDKNTNGKFQEYLAPFKKIESLPLEQHPDSRSNLYESFSELVSSIPWEKDDFIDITTMDIENDVKKSLCVQDKTPGSLYKIMEAHIKNGGKWTFKDEYFKEYFNDRIDKLI